MIEITKGTIEEHIIRILLRIYPITVKELSKQLRISKIQVTRVLHKLQTKRIIQMDPLPDKIYVRLLRRDFSFIGKRHQKKFIKHYRSKKPSNDEDYDGIMYL
jgi:predicted ArsR family transcriptional regulator